MPYAIRLQDGNGPYLRYFTDRAKDTAPVISFDDPADAEEYAQNHEIKNFAVAAVTVLPNGEPKETLT